MDDRRMASILDSWRGTPYLDAHDRKGVGVDCVRFVDKVLQELFRISLDPLPKLPAATSLHSPRGVALMTRLMRSRFGCETIRRPTRADLEVGDVVLESDSSRPLGGHALIVGPGMRLWHSDSEVGVGTASWGARATLLRAWRPDGKDTWATL